MEFWRRHRGSLPLEREEIISLKVFVRELDAKAKLKPSRWCM